MLTQIMSSRERELNLKLLVSDPALVSGGGRANGPTHGRWRSEELRIRDHLLPHTLLRGQEMEGLCYD